jgi:hypothetical protein
MEQTTQAYLRESYFSIPNHLSSSLIKKIQTILHKYPFDFLPRLTREITKQEKSKHLQLGDFIHKVVENADFLDKLAYIEVNLELTPSEKTMLEMYIQFLKENEFQQSMDSLVKIYCEVYNNVNSRFIASKSLFDIVFTLDNTEEKRPKELIKAIETTHKAIAEFYEKIEEYLKFYTYYYTNNKVILDDYFGAKAKETFEMLSKIPYVILQNKAYQALLQEGTVYDEYVIIWQYLGLSCKSMLDKFVIDHSRKKIKLIDIKTTEGDRSVFLKSYRRFGVYQQLAFYKAALQQLYPDYEIEVYVLAVYFSDDYSELFHISETDLIVGKEGGSFKSDSPTLFLKDGYFILEVCEKLDRTIADYLRDVVGFDKTIKQLSDEHLEVVFR